MTIHQRTSFDVEAAGLNATSKTNPAVAKMVAAWENKNSKRAMQGAGITLMAISLSACGSSTKEILEEFGDATAAVVDGADEDEVVEVDTPDVVAPAAQALTTADDAIAETADTALTGVVNLTTATLNIADVISTAGTDDSLTLTLTSDFAGFTAGVGSMAGVETLNINVAGTVARSFDATGTTGVATVNVDMNDTSFTYADAVETGLVFNVTNADASSSITVDYGSAAAIAATTDAITFNLTDVGASASAALSLVSASVETLTVASNGTVGNFADLSIGNSTAAVVTGTNALTVTAVDSSLSTYDGSEATGAQTLTLTAASPSSVKTGKGADAITVTDLASALSSVDLSTGIDTLTFSGHTGGTSQFVIAGAETIAFKGLATAASVFDLTSVTGLETINLIDGIDQNLTLSGATSSNITLTDTANVTYSGGNALTVANTGQFTFTSSTVNTAGYADALTITAASAADVDVTVGASTSIGAQTYAGALDVDVTVAGTLTGVVTAAATETFDLVSGSAGTAFGTLAHSAAAATTTVLTSGNSSDVMNTLAVSAPAAGNAITITAKSDVTFAAGTDFSGMKSLTVVTTGDFSDGANGNMGDASTSVTLNATSVNGDVTFSSGTLTAGGGAVNVTGSKLGVNTIVIDAGRQDIDIVGGIGVNDITLGDLTNGTAAATVDIDITTTGLLNTDELTFATSENLSGLSTSVTLSGIDTINGTTALTLNAATISGLTIATNTVAILTLEGTAAAESINLANLTFGGTTLNVNGAGGIDTITGSATADTIDGGASADVINSGAGSDAITGGTGADKINAGAGTNTMADAGTGADVITHNTAGATINATVTGTDTVTLTATQAGATITSILANAATVTAATSTEDVIMNGDASTAIQTFTGGGGGDTITGGTLADVLSGGGGADEINGGLVGDSMTGGAGADTFVIATSDSGQTAATADVINDYTTGTDIIDYTSAVGGAIVLTLVNEGVAGVGQAAIAADGTVTFNAADDTFAEQIVAVEAGMTAATAVVGETAIFEDADNALNSYIFISDGTAGVDGNDVLISIVGDLAGAITLTGGDITAIA